ncbi:hypothetical protein [Solimonas terrae]|uniref:DUF3718 domain-containing protein n=1 Tax=Solimonas terrae TaxID=1396819 RepID=A0A6M2BYD5_9GAMM|nr:hypothetical protein [Solimonas terrae]NGY06869.1 hypothetical protein [Solimonas terrae]
MRYLLALAAIAACPAYADTPSTSVSPQHLQQAATLAGDYRQCLQDTLGDRYINVGSRDPLQLAAEVEKSCETRLTPVNQYLSTMGYTQPVVTQTVVELKAMADGAAIAYVHRMPRYRF